MPHQLKYLALFVSLLSTTCFGSGDVKWGYEGAVGPEKWGDLSSEFAICKTGQMQAPIDIPVKSAAQVQSPIKAEYKDTTAEVINNGHTIQVSLPNGGGAILDGISYQIVNFICIPLAKKKWMEKLIPLMPIWCIKVPMES